jgi:dipeptidyl aminopeptidase/acylaminoacyl peptidase
MKPYHRRFAARWLSIVAALLLVSTAGAVSAAPSGGASPAGVGVESWLVLGPVPVPLPAYSDEGATKIGVAELLDYPFARLSDLVPQAGLSVESFGGGSVAWSVFAADTGGVALPASAPVSAVAYLAAYVEVPRWTKLEIETRATQPFELFIDGSSVVKRTGSQKLTDAKAKSTASAKLTTGKHLLIAKTVRAPSDSVGEWRLGVRLAPSKGFSDVPRVSVDPKRGLDVRDVLDGPSVSDLRLSPDGEYVALPMSLRKPPDGESEDWLEVRRFADAGRVMTLDDVSGASDWRWAPNGHRLSYTETKDESGSIRVIDIDKGRTDTVVRDVKGLTGYQWSRDGTFIVYTVQTKAPKNEKGVKRLEGLYDKRDYERDKTHLYMTTVPEGMTRRLTAGDVSTVLYDIHPDGRSILVGRSYEDLSARPYSTTELVRLDLDDDRVEILWKGRFLATAVWSPDGKKILVTAGPSSFGSVGLDVPEGTIPNDYDTEAYLFDPVAKTAEPLTKDFDPTITAAFWPAGGNVYFVAEETEYVRLYRYGVKSRKFERIAIDCDVIHDTDIANKNSAVVAYGSSADRPPRVFAVDAGKAKGRLFEDPTADQFSRIVLGKVEDWNFKTKDGTTIVGRIQYPPDFDPNRKWPCIVYYYGGTSPVDRSFGTRYPKGLWTANGYVVYVLQPSGATGFGQKFSAAHVNDWGKVVSEEIIEGTKEFLAAHPFVDPARVGCIGASFGGFMTELLVTRTDIFAAAVSHAGISSIASYWGEGYWGYEYNAVSAANSFPWNRPDIYVQQSPLFAADKIVTPLLLLHGTADTNVPTGESEQMYTALKLLGKEVEYLRIEGQNHFILDYKKRIIWSDAIIAWFDRWLKGQPEWWDDMYPPVAKAGKKEPADIGIRKAEVKDHGLVLFGEVTRDDILKEIPDWGAEYDTYTPSLDSLQALEKGLKNVRFVCVFGTWCSDSRTQVPRFWRLLDDLGVPQSSFRMFAVASSRFTDQMGVPKEVLDWSRDVKAWYDVTAVETIIVERGGREIGRIVESPSKSLEEDLLEILRK